jgi:HrpA-like RNA helicase
VELTGDVVKKQSQGESERLFDDISKLHVEVYTPSAGIAVRKPFRRIFIATNVAETGITIHTLRYVIDTGWFKSSEFDPNFAVEILATKPVTKSMSIQRGGRSGRECIGTVYYMYTKDTFDAMQTDQYPDIIKNEITLDLLSLIICEVDKNNLANASSLIDFFEKSPNTWNEINETKIDVFKIDLLDLPSADSIHYSIEKLFTLGAIDSNCIPTKIGFIMNKFRFISIESIRTLLAGYAWGVSIIDLVDMIAMIETGIDTIIPEELRTKYTASELYSSNISKKFSYIVADDFIVAMRIFKEFQKYLGILKSESGFTDTESIQEWADSQGLSISGLYKVVELREDIINILSMIGLNPYENNHNSLVNNLYSEDLETYVKQVKQCIFEGYKMNIAIWNTVEKKYVSRKTHIPINIAKYGDTNPKYLVDHRLLCLPKPSSSLYQIGADAISVLDGYIPIDVNFDALV